jgi:hypothetical protein
MDLSGFVMTDGCTAVASGRVVACDGQTWFGPAPGRMTLEYYAPGQEPPPRRSGSEVLVRGVDLSRLANRWEKDGAIEGWATLSGTWHDEELTVSDQAGPGYPTDREDTPRWDVPPCAPPQGGWPRGKYDDLLGDDVDLEGEETVNVTIFRPSRRSEVVVIASEAPEVTRARLTPHLGDHLCVVQSRWTCAQVNDVREQLHARARWITSGETATEDAQLRITAELVFVSADFSAYATTVPDDLLSVSVWLTPTA